MTNTIGLRRVLIPLATLVSVVVSACADPFGPNRVRETVFVVAPQRVPCRGFVDMMCLQVREGQDTAWHPLYQEISGFTFEPGYEYQLQVRIYPVPVPPADGSSVEYRLVWQIRKTRVAG